MSKTDSHLPGAPIPFPPTMVSAKPAEKALLDVNQRLQSILFANEVATWTWDIAEDRVVADQNMTRLFGLSPQDALSAPLDKYLLRIHPEDRHAVSSAIAASLAGSDDKYEVDYRLLREDGTVSWVTARGKVERDGDGKPVRFPGVVIDITLRKAAEQKFDEIRHALEQQAQLYDLALSSITDFAYVLDEQARFVYVNKPLLQLWGLALPDALGKDFFELNYPHELAARLLQEVQQVFRTKTGLTGETPYTSPTGANGHYEYIFRPVFDSNGNVQVVAGSTRDVTRRKREVEELRESQENYRILAQSLEDQVRERTAQLEDRNREVLVHSEQLRELSVQLMKTQDQERRHIARELHDSAGQIIAALSMNLSRLATQLKSSNPELLQLADETRTYLEELNQEIRTTSYLLHPPLLDEVGLRAAVSWYVQGLKERAGLDVTLDISEEFDRPSEEIELTIFRAIQECLTNIHRHSGSKSASIKIVRDGSNVLLHVRDFGRGIPRESLAKIQARGAGVGLRGLRERVHQFSGEISIESKLGSGTTVLITLPERGPN